MERSKTEEVRDIGGSKLQSNLGCRTAEILQKKTSQTLPDELLYTDEGLSIWNQLISHKKYYQTHDERDLFIKHGRGIAEIVQDGVTMVDIGAGDTRKVEHLLAAFEEAQKPATYLALDISKASLDQNVGYLIDRHCSSTSKVRCAGIWGTFENGREWISEQLQGPRLFLSLGSVLCNDEFKPAVQHLKEWKDVMRPGDLLLVGMDGHTAEADKDKIEDAYHSQPELARRFFLTGFEHANKLLGADLFQPQDWKFSCRLEHGDLATRHRVFFESNKDVTCGKLDISIKAGEKYEWFDSHKYGENNVRLMCTKAGLSVVQVLKLPESEFRQYIIRLKDDQDLKEDDDSGVSGVV